LGVSETVEAVRLREVRTVAVLASEANQTDGRFWGKWGSAFENMMLGTPEF